MKNSSLILSVFTAEFFNKFERHCHFFIVQKFCYILVILGQNCGETMHKPVHIKIIKKELSKTLENILILAKLKPELLETLENDFLIPFIQKIINHFQDGILFEIIDRIISGPEFTKSKQFLNTLINKYPKIKLQISLSNVFLNDQKNAVQIIQKKITKTEDENLRQSYDKKMREYISTQHKKSMSISQKGHKTSMRKNVSMANHKKGVVFDPVSIYNKPVFGIHKFERQSLKPTRSPIIKRSMGHRQFKDDGIINLKKMNNFELEEFVRRHSKTNEQNYCNVSEVAVVQFNGLGQIETSMKKDMANSMLHDPALNESVDLNQIFGVPIFEATKP